MEDKIDRQGICPNCKTSWAGTDVYESLARLACNSGKSHNELIRMAASYGWQEHNKINFSNLISHEMNDDRNLLECPNIVCQHVFDRYTGEEYKNMYEARKGVNTIIIRDKEKVIEPVLKPIHVTQENRFEVEAEIMRKENDDCPFEV